MNKAIIKNTIFTSFNVGDIIDIYSLEDILTSNIDDDLREWINMNGIKFIGFCLSKANPTDDGTIDFTGLYEEDVEWV